MKRPVRIPRNAYWCKDAEAWCVKTEYDGYEVFTYYNDDGSVCMVLEMEI